MQNLSSIILFLLLSVSLSAQTSQSPHEKDLAYDCNDCHTTEGWKVDRQAITFDHDSTAFPLQGIHRQTDCQACHSSLKFSEAETTCVSCHTDVHRQSVGSECSRCHNTNSWIVNKMNSIHRKSRFPLTGAHQTADCEDCHEAESFLNFEPLGVECVDCHREEYLSSQNPDHVAADYSTDCNECHLMNAYQWTARGFNHSFFPLTNGHALDDCNACHEPGEPYGSISSDCYSCHEEDFNQATSPDHIASNFSTNCSECHSTQPGWSPATFRDHDGQFFPIYSGEHDGTWDNCSECHPSPSNYAEFTCISCHEHNQGDMDEEHDEVDGYAYESQACLACHPTGSGDEDFDHRKTAFPLTGAHTSTECTQCHSDGFAGTPTNCVDCHSEDYNQSTNPSHTELALSEECTTCHTTKSEWAPAAFPNHNEYYVLEGAHAEIASNCNTCHSGDYLETPTSCYGCHESDYNQTTDPDHAGAQFSTDCQSCHDQNAWEPASFEHDAQYFPVYSGSHQGTWENCTECHTNPSDYARFSCIECHEHNEADMNDEHDEVSGYSYDSEACFQCHPNGEADDAFDHSQTDFPLTGAHTSASCESCHSDGYTGTSTYCADCHTTDFNQSTNPNHTELSLSQDCQTCHTTNPGWAPADFPNHDDYYQLTGAHATISNDCNACHSSDYLETPTTCFGCHESDYNQTTEPDHASSQFSTDCETCHNENVWDDINFTQHDGQYFPVYSGEHSGTWGSCSECHANPSNYADFTCVECHEHNQTDMDDEHDDVSGYVYESSACLDCHPSGGGGKRFMKSKDFEKQIKD